MKRIAVFIFVVTLVLVVIYWFTTSKKPMNISDLDQKTSITPTTTLDIKATENTKYVYFSDGVLSKYKDKKRVLFFYASWCPTCRPADSDISKNTDNLPDGTVVIRVNYNDPDTDSSEKSLAEKYGITYQHTFVQIDSNDNVITKWNGGGFSQLLSNLK